MAKAPRAPNERRKIQITRELVARVLLVCEGKKTEPNYLKELVNELRVPTVGFEVIGEGSDPSMVVSRAVARAETGDGDYDFIFCIFDRDKHEKYLEACDNCRRRVVRREGNEPTKLIAITSNPSFEYWLLFHLNKTTSPYRATGKKSSGDQVLADFRRAYKVFTGKKYEKGATGVYAALRKRLDESMKIAEGHNKNGLGNPHSLVGAMIEVMRAISEGRKPDVGKIENLQRISEKA